MPKKEAIDDLRELILAADKVLMRDMNFPGAGDAHRDRITTGKAAIRRARGHSAKLMEQLVLGPAGLE